MVLRKIMFLSAAFIGMTARAELIDITTIDASIQIDLRYMTPDNFAQQAVYPTTAKAYLVKEAAQALHYAQEELKSKGYCLLVWDAYRPLSVQRIFWQIVPDERYVMPPSKGSRHNRGCAVDVTLLDKQGNLVEMPTAFDDFSEKAHRDYQDISPIAHQMRSLLEEVMVKHGFEGLPTEWWHFDFKGWQQHPLLDVTFDELIAQQ